MIHKSLIAAAAAFATYASAAAAQGAVISGTSSAQLVELRPLALDSAAIGTTDSISTLLRQTSSGIVTSCGSGDAYCYFYKSLPKASLVAMMQDLDVTAWGFGQGLSFHGQFRARTASGDGRDLWPQAQQTFDAIAMYLELSRDAFDVRAGRQWIASGLGVFNFDGGAVTVKPTSAFDINMYGGRSLVQGLDRTLGEAALAPVEDMPPPDDSYLIGAIAQVRKTTLGSLRVQYQREIEANGTALYSERAAADATIYVGPGSLNGELSRDIATNTFNALAASLQMPILESLHARAEIRHFEPYFDLWTIWGAFAPVGYNEGTLSLDWSGSGLPVSVSVSGGRRKYDDTNTGVESLPLRTDAWNTGVNARYRATSTLWLEGGYDVDLGFGASTTDGNLVLRWSPGARGSIGVRGLAFQNLNEFTVGAGHVLGGGLEGSYTLFPDLRLAGDAIVYRHVGDDGPQTADWNQRRVSLRLEWTLGSEPGWGRTLGKGRVP